MANREEAGIIIRNNINHIQIDSKHVQWGFIEKTPLNALPYQGSGLTISYYNRLYEKWQAQVTWSRAYYPRDLDPNCIYAVGGKVSAWNNARIAIQNDYGSACPDAGWHVPFLFVLGNAQQYSGSAPSWADPKGVQIQLLADSSSCVPYGNGTGLYLYKFGPVTVNPSGKCGLRIYNELGTLVFDSNFKSGIPSKISGTSSKAASRDEGFAIQIPVKIDISSMPLYGLDIYDTGYPFFNCTAENIFTYEKGVAGDDTSLMLTQADEFVHGYIDGLRGYRPLIFDVTGM